MDKFLKVMIAVGAASVLFFTVQFARADEGKVCANGVWAEQQETFKAVENVTVQQLNAAQIANMVAEIGSPPHADGDFDAFLVVNGPIAMVFAVQDGCTKDRFGPTHVDNLNRILGLVNVRAPGERVD